MRTFSISLFTALLVVAGATACSHGHPRADCVIPFGETLEDAFDELSDDTLDDLPRLTHDVSWRGPDRPVKARNTIRACEVLGIELDNRVTGQRSVALTIARYLDGQQALEEFRDAEPGDSAPDIEVDGRYKVEQLPHLAPGVSSSVHLLECVIVWVSLDSPHEFDWDPAWVAWDGGLVARSDLQTDLSYPYWLEVEDVDATVRDLIALFPPLCDSDLRR